MIRDEAPNGNGQQVRRMADDCSHVIGRERHLLLDLSLAGAPIHADAWPRGLALSFTTYSRRLALRWPRQLAPTTGRR